MTGPCQHDPRYLSYFACFNRQDYFEAHEVLEALWLPQRQAENGAFYKGLIQLAGAFVHWTKQRRGPAIALLKLAETNLSSYPATHEGLEVSTLVDLIDGWLRALQAINGCAPVPDPRPQLHLRQHP